MIDLLLMELWDTLLEVNKIVSTNILITSVDKTKGGLARTYLQLPLRQWGVGNVYLLVLSSWKVNIAENPIAVMGL